MTAGTGVRPGGAARPAPGAGWGVASDLDHAVRYSTQVTDPMVDAWLGDHCAGHWAVERSAAGEDGLIEVRVSFELEDDQQAFKRLITTRPRRDRRASADRRRAGFLRQMVIAWTVRDRRDRPDRRGARDPWPAGGAATCRGHT